MLIRKLIYRTAPLLIPANLEGKTQHQQQHLQQYHQASLDLAIHTQAR